MTKEQLREALLRAMPGSGNFVREFLPAILAPRMEEAAPTVSPDFGQRDVPAGPRKKTLDEELTALTRSVADLNRAEQSRVQPLAESSPSRSSDGKFTVSNLFRSSLASQLMPVFKGGSSGMGSFTLAPLLSGLIGLFRGGAREEPDPLRSYITPPLVAIEAAVDRSGNLHGVSYGAGAQARLVQSAAPVESGPRITVQVQAMDSRSFIDHSHEIATAVREALLSGHGLTDVFSEL